MEVLNLVELFNLTAMNSSGVVHFDIMCLDRYIMESGNTVRTIDFVRQNYI